MKPISIYFDKTLAFLAIVLALFATAIPAFAEQAATAVPSNEKKKDEIGQLTSNSLGERLAEARRQAQLLSLKRIMVSHAESQLSSIQRDAGDTLNDGSTGKLDPMFEAILKDLKQLDKAVKALDMEQQRLSNASANPPVTAATSAVPQPVDLLVEGIDILEAAVHRGEAHVGDFIEVAQLLHHQLADQPRRHFALPESAQVVADPLDGGLDVGRADRTLLQRLAHAGEQLFRVEWFARPVALDHLRHQQLRGLERREPLLALQTLATPADLPTLAGEAGVDHLRFAVAAEGAIHGCGTRSGTVDGEATAQCRHLAAHALEYRGIGDDATLAVG